MPRVSVVLPTYNSAKYIEESIKSILNQTYRDFELIIYDDGSTDNSNEIIHKALQDNNGIITHHYSGIHNKGTAFVKNYAIRNLATGELISMHYSDDIDLDNKLERLVTFWDTLNNNGDKNFPPHIVSAGYYYMDENNKIYDKYIPEFTSLQIASMLPFRNIVNDACAMLPKKVFEDLGGYDDKNFPVHALDYDFWLRAILNRYNIYMLNEPLAMLRFRSDSTSNSNKLELDRCRSLAQSLYMQRLSERTLFA